MNDKSFVILVSRIVSLNLPHASVTRYYPGDLIRRRNLLDPIGSDCPTISYRIPGNESIDGSNRRVPVKIRQYPATGSVNLSDCRIPIVFCRIIHCSVSSYNYPGGEIRESEQSQDLVRSHPIVHQYRT